MLQFFILLLFVTHCSFSDQQMNDTTLHKQKQEPVTESSTPLVCGPHSHATSCAVCDPSCFDPVSRPCPLFCARGPPTGCECDKGYLRHGTRCIKPENCPKPCRPNQTWSRCPTPCEPTCHDPYPICAFNTTCGKAKAKCQCKPGFYRKSSCEDAICVPWWQCHRTGGSTPRPPMQRAPGGGKGGPWNWWGRKPM